MPGPDDLSSFFALIGDVVASRAAPDRARLQTRIQETLAELNEAPGLGAAAPLRLTAGDEIQGLLVRGGSVVDVVTRLADALRPHGVIWGLGLGAVTTALSDDVALVDGPCFHRARAALDEATRDGRWLGVAGVAPPHGEAAEALADLVGSIRADWTDVRYGYVAASRDRTQREVARDFGVNESTVSRALARAHARAVLRGEAALRTLLDDAVEVPAP